VESSSTKRIFFSADKDRPRPEPPRILQGF
jgi:hypothetical protein